MKTNYALFSMRPHTEDRNGVRTRSRVRILGAFMILIGALGGGGCTTLGVKPWEHDLLAEQAMQVDAYPLETTIDEHIYFSKEASSGGRSFAGGGCGCN